MYLKNVMEYYDQDKMQKDINVLKLKGFQEVLQVHLLEIPHICLILQTMFKVFEIQCHPPPLSMLAEKQKQLKHYSDEEDAAELDDGMFDKILHKFSIQ